MVQPQLNAKRLGEWGEESSQLYIRACSLLVNLLQGARLSGMRGAQCEVHQA